MRRLARALLVLALLPGILTACRDGSSRVAAPAVQSSSGPSTPQSRIDTVAPRAHDTGRPARIIDSAHSRIGSFTVNPEAPEHRFVTWYRCLNADCDRRAYASAVTSDGFATRHVVRLPVRTNFGYDAQPAGPRHFIVTRNAFHPVVVDVHGRVTPLRLGATTGPLASGEIPVRRWGIAKRNPWIGIDPRTGRAHSLTMPPGNYVEMTRTPAGQLRAVSLTAYAWSDDGGADWHSIPFPTTSDLPLLVPSARDDVHAVILGGDGATLFPWGTILVSTDGRTWTSYPGPERPTAYVDSPAIGPDGELLVQVDGWSDQRPGRPGRHPLGFYRVPGWTVPDSVPASGPFESGSPASVLDQAITGSRMSTYALTPDQEHVVVSSDGARTWTRTRAR